MPECFVPQYSAQKMWYVPGLWSREPHRGQLAGDRVHLHAERRDRIVVQHVLGARCVIRTGRPIGTCISLISRTPSGCCTFHIHCLPTTKMSIASAGGVARRKNNYAPQTNMTIDSTNGMNVQVSSSASDP